MGREAIAMMRAGGERHFLFDTFDCPVFQQKLMVMMLVSAYFKVMLLQHCRATTVAIMDTSGLLLNGMSANILCNLLGFLEQTSKEIRNLGILPVLLFLALLNFLLW